MLYAAKFRKIVNLTMGVGTIITLDAHEKAKTINNFVCNELDSEILYTSKHWSAIINNQWQIYGNVIIENAQLIVPARTILSPIKSDEIYIDLVTNLTKSLSKIKKDNRLLALIKHIKNANHLLNSKGILGVLKKTLLAKHQT